MYIPTIGLEIHTRLKTKTKMFCGCLNDSKEHHPNINICPVCSGQPGTLPTINKEAIKEVIKVGLALNSEIATISKFDRKNYFYPDLPKGYQISQYDKPFCLGGALNIDGRAIRITRVHLEEDAGKLIHDEKSNASLVDLNRAGTPLMELVTEPDIRNSTEAKKFCEELQILLRYLGVSDANMEDGEMRCEANISISDKEGKLGTKVEVKNLNSFKAVERAIEYEIKRQAEVLDSGLAIDHETRGWDENKQQTFPQRSKEEAHDYRYFPEPDLPILDIPKLFDLDDLKSMIPELPFQKRARFISQFSLSGADVDLLVKDKELAGFFENVVSELEEWIAETGVKLSAQEDKKVIKLAANYLLSDLTSLMNEKGASTGEMLITPENFAELITFVYEDKISSAVAKSVLKEMFASGQDPSQIIEEQGLLQVSDAGELEKIVEAIIVANPKPVEDLRSGKENALQFLVGQGMKMTKGKASPAVLQDLFKKKINK